MQITLMHFVTLCFDVHENTAFSNGEILTFFMRKSQKSVILGHLINRILHSCSCIIEFIKLVGGNQ